MEIKTTDEIKKDVPEAEQIPKQETIDKITEGLSDSVKKRSAVLKWLAITFLISAIILGLLYFQIPTRVIAKGYPVQGIDVSHYQGQIDWQQMKAQGIGFAYIKATEGSSYTDECYQQNMTDAVNAGIAAGAYHFFSFDSSGVTQAEYFIQTVGDDGTLIPVVDAEYYGNKRKNPPEAEAVRRELTELLQILEAQYGCKPMIYSTQPFYQRFLEGYYEDYPLWIRGVYLPPMQDNAVWQYSDLLQLKGMSGEEKYVDGDVCRELGQITR